MDDCGIYDTALYLRTSADSQNIDFQRDFLLRYAKTKGLNVVIEYGDKAKSGMNIERMGLKSLKNSVEYKSFKVVLIYHSDRLSRKISDMLDLIKFFNENDVRIISAFDGSTFERETPEKEHLSNIALSFNQFFVECTRRKILDGKKYALQRGHFCSRPPIGYKVIDHKLIIDEDKAQIIREIFVDRKKGMSWGQLSSKYNVKKSTLQGIVSNPIYKKGLQIKAIIDGKEKVVGKVEPIL